MFKQFLNKLETRIAEISIQNFRPEIFTFEWFLVGISHIYGMVVRFRFLLYKVGVLKTHTLPCFVISIGNIVVGGAGKTPMTIYIAGLLNEMKKKALVVSRGYKGKSKKDFLIVSDGENIFSTAEEAGDEPYMMAKQKIFPVVVGKDRFKAGMKAMDSLRPDVILLDDGFQHLKLARDLDLLLLDYSNPLGNSRFLPAGRLRENTQISAQRADAVIFTRCYDNDEDSEKIKQVMKHYPGCPWFKTFHISFVFKHIIHDQSSEKRITSVKSLNGKKAVLFSGIAKNRSFYHSMEESGVNILDHLEFIDHYRYKEHDILMINRLAEKLGADYILTTEKDWVKLGQDVNWGLNLIVIGIQIEFEHPEEFKFFLKQRLKK